MAETYPYEQLDGRRFQRLAQCLILAENPKVQCFPLSGPDGGRDAVAFQLSRTAHSYVDSVIFQVKFHEPTQNGTPTGDELYKWIVSTIKREIPKIRMLIERGAAEYIFITNVSASGHKDVGLRDRTQAWATDNVPLPTRFWWREDLDTRMTSNPQLAFQFMLFNGPGSVEAYFNSIIDSDVAYTATGIQVSRQRTEINTLLVYLADQYKNESVLRFKQADLDSTPLFDFFIDVQVNLTDTSSAKHIARYRRSISRLNMARRYGTNDFPAEDIDFSVIDDETEWGLANEIGAANLFLNSGDMGDFKSIVVEGAPGQGKSTLTQYIAQVHRALILNKRNDLEKVPKSYSDVDVKLPLRIELRRLATWLQGGSPWAETTPERTPRTLDSLENYIVDHIRYATGGLRFTVDNLVAIVKATPTLLLLDGLDEVADAELRQGVVECCETFVQRMTAIGADIQVIATSRPVAFAKSASFSVDSYTYFTLSDLSRSLINEYTNAWIKIRNVPTEQATELAHILDTSLGQAHVADLARNPMQLAILIWLVYVKGWSLPDQRTALYEAYMSTFLDREADKTPTVRQYRDLLMELHGFLGWVLHARSEVGNSQDAAGDVTETELKDLLRRYLESEERPTEIVEKLFHGVERVFVLVSRVVGRFEFEVQPLREFFAARYLYKTSPHSPSASPMKGTRPDRLEALIRNPYWLNVARFFCGWYDKGELADLSRRIEDLCNDAQYAQSAHPIRLIQRLLGDRVTTASRRDTRKLADLLITPLGVRFIVNDPDTSQQMLQRQHLLPEDAGLPELISKAKEGLLTDEPVEVISEYSRLLHSQADRFEIAQWWSNQFGSTTLSRSEWLRRGLACGALGTLELTRLLSAVDPSSFSPVEWAYATEAGRIDVAAQDPLWMSSFITALGDGVRPRQFGERSELRRFCARIGSFLGSQSARHQLRDQADTIDVTQYPRVSDELASLNTMVIEMTAHWNSQTSFTPRDLGTQAEIIRSVFGDCWAAWRMALIASRVTSKRRDEPSVPFHDDSQPLFARAKTAWRHAEDPGYWSSALSESAGSGGTAAATLACMLEFGSMHTILDNIDLIFARWSELTETQVGALRDWSASTSRESKRSRGEIGILEGSWEGLPAAFTAMLSSRTKVGDMPRLISGIQVGRLLDRDRDIVSGIVINFCLHQMSTRRSWGNTADLVRDEFPASGKYQNAPWRITLRDLIRHPARWPTELVRDILENPNRYPAAMLQAAEYVHSGRIMSEMPSLLAVARDEEWFPDAPAV